METITIIQDLNRRFAQPLPEFYARRVIFWYDEDKEFEDSISNLQLEKAKVLVLNGWWWTIQTATIWFIAH